MAACHHAATPRLTRVAATYHSAARQTRRAPLLESRRRLRPQRLGATHRPLQERLHPQQPGQARPVPEGLRLAVVERPLLPVGRHARRSAAPRDHAPAGRVLGTQLKETISGATSCQKTTCSESSMMAASPAGPHVQDAHGTLFDACHPPA